MISEDNVRFFFIRGWVVTRGCHCEIRRGWKDGILGGWKRIIVDFDNWEMMGTDPGISGIVTSIVTSS